MTDRLPRAAAGGSVRPIVPDSVAEAWWSLGIGAVPAPYARRRFRTLLRSWLPEARREGFGHPAVAVLEAGIFAHAPDAELQGLAADVVREARRIAGSGASGEDWLPHVAIARLARNASSDPTWMLVRREAARTAPRDPVTSARMKTRLMLGLLRDADVAVRGGSGPPRSGDGARAFDPWTDSPDVAVPELRSVPDESLLDEAAVAWESAHPERAATARFMYRHWTSHWAAHGRGGRPYSLEPGDLLEILNASSTMCARDGADPFAYVPALSLRAELGGSSRSELRRILAERMRRLASSSGGRRIECGPLRSIEPIRVRERLERVLPSEFALPAVYRNHAIVDGRLLGFRREFRVREIHPLEVVVASVPAAGPPGPPSVPGERPGGDAARDAREWRAAERGLAVILSETMEELLERTPRSRVRLRWLQVEGDGRHPPGARIARSDSLGQAAGRDLDAPVWQRRPAWCGVFRRDAPDPPSDGGAAAVFVHSYLSRESPGRRVVVAVGACPVERDRNHGRSVAARAWFDGRGARPGFRAYVATGRRSGLGRNVHGLSLFEAHELLSEAAAEAIADGLEAAS